MASIKVVLRAKKNKNGTQPLAIRITQDRKTSFLHLNKHIEAIHWDAAQSKVKKAHPNSTYLNNYLLAKLKDATNKSLEVEAQNPETTSYTISKKIKPKAGVTFFPYAQRYLENLEKTGNHNCHSAEKSRIKHFPAIEYPYKCCKNFIGTAISKRQ